MSRECDFFNFIWTPLKQQRRNGRTVCGAVSLTYKAGLTLIVNVCATVFSIGFFCGAFCFWTLFTEADCFDLVRAYTLLCQLVGDGDRATLTQCQVVFGAAACIGVAFNANTLVGVSGQVLSVHLYNRLILLFNNVAIVSKINRALLCQRAVRVEWIHNGVGCACSSSSSAVYRSRATRCQCGSQTSNGKCFCNARTHGNFLYQSQK